MILTFDNVISPSYANLLEGLICNAPYYRYMPKTVTSDTDRHTAVLNENVRDNGQMVYPFFGNNGVWPDAEVVFPSLDGLICILRDKLATTDFAFQRIIRAKANILLKDVGFTSYNYNEPHVDNDVPEMKTTSIIYYVCDSDGDTVLFNEFYNVETKDLTVAQRVSPKKNRITVFDSERYHASCNPIASNARFVLNMVVA